MDLCCAEIHLGGHTQYICTFTIELALGSALFDIWQQDKSGVSACILAGCYGGSLPITEFHGECIDFTGNYGKRKGRGTWAIFDIEIPKDLDVRV